MNKVVQIGTVIALTIGIIIEVWSAIIVGGIAAAIEIFGAILMFIAIPIIIFGDAQHERNMARYHAWVNSIHTRGIGYEQVKLEAKLLGPTWGAPKRKKE